MLSGLMLELSRASRLSSCGADLDGHIQDNGRSTVVFCQARPSLGGDLRFGHNAASASSPPGCGSPDSNRWGSGRIHRHDTPFAALPRTSPWIGRVHSRTSSSFLACFNVMQEPQQGPGTGLDRAALAAHDNTERDDEANREGEAYTTVGIIRAASVAVGHWRAMGR